MLPKSEKQVMDLLWSCDEPLTAAEIIQVSENRIWKPSYVHLLINSLLEKKLIEVAGMKRTTKNYARTFQAAKTREEYLAEEMYTQFCSSKKDLPKLLSALITGVDDEALIEELEAVIQKRKEEFGE